MIKKIITEISEEDFRKLDLKVFRYEREETNERSHRFVMKEVSLNEILDRQIRATVESGYESDMRDLEIPVTIAIHEPYTEEELKKYMKDNPYFSEEACRERLLLEHCYLDKYMNRFTGSQTYQIGWGITHLYSSRDYYECREEDYWRVRKDETKVIYRIKLSAHWLDEFVLKHKTESDDWPYDFLPDGVSPDYIAALLCVNYDLQEDGSWKEVGRYGRFIYEYTESHIPVDAGGNKIIIRNEDSENERRS